MQKTQTNSEYCTAFELEFKYDFITHFNHIEQKLNLPLLMF